MVLIHEQSPKFLFMDFANFALYIKLQKVQGTKRSVTVNIKSYVTYLGTDVGL